MMAQCYLWRHFRRFSKVHNEGWTWKTQHSILLSSVYIPAKVTQNGLSVTGIFIAVSLFYKVHAPVQNVFHVQFQKDSIKSCKTLHMREGPKKYLRQLNAKLCHKTFSYKQSLPLLQALPISTMCLPMVTHVQFPGQNWQPIMSCIWEGLHWCFTLFTIMITSLFSPICCRHW